MFKDNLDLKYQASTDKLKKHSALRIINPDHRFSGNYKCRVSTFREEVSAQQDVLVYGKLFLILHTLPVLLYL